MISLAARGLGSLGLQWHLPGTWSRSMITVQMLLGRVIYVAKIFKKEKKSLFIFLNICRAIPSMFI